MKRLVHLDIAKGLAIIAVILGHQKGSPLFIPHLVFCWHLPIFFLIAGFVYKPKSNKEMINNSFQRLILPYLFICAFYLVYSVVIKGINTFPQQLLASFWASGEKHRTVLLWGEIPIIGSIWFLPALFWTRVVYNYLSKYKYKQLIAISLSVIATITGYYIISLPTGILEGVSAMAFFTIGDVSKNYTDILRQKKWYLITIGLISGYLFVQYSMLSMCRCWYKYYPLDLIPACLVSWIIISFLKNIDNTSLIAKTFQWIGINSLTILCMHNIETHTFNYEKWMHLPYVWYYLFLAKILVCVIGTVILGKIPITQRIFAIQLPSILLK